MYILSYTTNSNMNRWRTYVRGNPQRQEILETALDWVSHHSIETYMAKHRNDTEITELVRYFETVVDWIDSIFEYTGSEMCGQPWGDFYEKYRKNAYSKDAINKRLDELLSDTQVSDKRGIIEYLLGGEKETKLLNVRVFDQKTKKAVYKRQTEEAIKKKISNCPLCAIGHNANAKKIYKENEMDADHVTAWSRGGATDEKNCQMLCKTHNRAKGNR